MCDRNDTMNDGEGTGVYLEGWIAGIYTGVWLLARLGVLLKQSKACSLTLAWEVRLRNCAFAMN